jgi:ketosteroid isomerase-like protein
VSPPTPPLAPTAQESIAELVHLYSDAVVRGDVDQWSRCWADDASWMLRPDRTATGRQAIVELWLRAMQSLDGVVQNVLHGTVSLDGPNEARGRWYIMEHFRRVTGEAGLLLAHYDDSYVHRDGRWLFANRTLVPHYQGPPDLSGSFSP